MTVREYIGARYVPLFMGDWDNTKTYEPLSIVQYQGNSYTSRQAVPTGIDILNTVYWANTGNYNAQVEQYRQEVQTFDARIDAIEESEAESERLRNSISNSLINHANYAPWKMMEIWKTYMFNRDKFFYGAGSILTMDYNANTKTFSPATIEGVNEGGNTKFGITCTPSVMLALLGVPYENSRMENGTINPTDPPTLSGGYNYSISGGKTLNLMNYDIWNLYSEGDHVTYSSEFAKLLNDVGLLHEREDFSSTAEFAPGDILFDVIHDVDSEQYWNGIGHCSIYIGAFSNGCWVAETASESNIFNIVFKTSIASNVTKYYARIPVPGNATIRNLLETRVREDYVTLPYTYTNQGSPGAMHSLKFDEYNDSNYELSQYDVCTCLLKIPSYTKTANVRISFFATEYGSGSTPITSDVTHNIGSLNLNNKATYLGNDWYYCPIFIPDNLINVTHINGITLRPFADSNFNLTIEDIKFYDRLILPSADSAVYKFGE